MSNHSGEFPCPAYQATLLTISQQKRAERRPKPRVAGELTEPVGAPPGDRYHKYVRSDERRARGDRHWRPAATLATQPVSQDMIYDGGRLTYVCRS